MKIVQINVSNYGSTGSIMNKIHELGIKNGLDMYAFYGRGKKSKVKNIKKIGNQFDFFVHTLISRIFDLQGHGSYFSTKKLIKNLKEINPDVIHLHNIHGYYINFKLLFNYLKESGVNVIWTLHDCWAFTGHCSYFDKVNCNLWKDGCYNCPQKKEYPKSIIFDRSRKNFNEKKIIFNMLDKEKLTIVTPSIWLKNLVKQSFLSSYEVKVINNDIDNSIFKPTISDYRKINNLENKKLILGVANVWDDRKGYDFFIKLSKIISDDYKIILVGLNDKQISDLPSNIIGIKRTSSKKELAELYTTVDVFFNPTKEENYPTVNLEAQACGTPVITFNSGGCKETLFNSNSIVIKKDEENIMQIIDDVCSKEKNNKNLGIFNNFEKYIEIYKNYHLNKKVLFLSNTPAPYRIDFFNELSKNVDLMVVFEKKKSDERDDSWNHFNHDSFNLKFLNGIKISTDKAISPSIVKVIKENRDRQIIVGNPTTPTGIISILYMKFKKIPYSIEIDGGFAKKERYIKKWFKTLIFCGAEKYFSTSNEGDNYLLSYGAEKEKIIRYPFTSIKESDILKKKLTLSEKINLKQELGINEEKVIISVGRFIYSKGYDLLIKASSNFNNNVGIYIIGGQPTEEYFKLKEKYNAKNVHFVDFKQKEELKKYYICADLFVFPTRSDVWGLVINEAMAVGLPVITTNKCIAGLELIENGINGYIVETDNVQELANKINYCLDNESLLERMKENNLNKIKNYTIEKMAKCHQERI